MRRLYLPCMVCVERPQEQNEAELSYPSHFMGKINRVKINGSHSMRQKRGCCIDKLS